MRDIIERIQLMGLQETYMFMLGEKEVPTDVKNKMRFGIKIPVDIYDFLDQNFSIKQKSGKIIYRGKPISMEQINTEMEERLILGKEWLLKEYAQKSPIGRRGG